MIRDENTLEDLITDFLTKEDSGTRLLEEYFGTRNIRRLWHTKAIKRCGTITGDVRYELHGIGRFIHLLKETVDFDYGLTVKLMDLIFGAYTNLLVTDHPSIKKLQQRNC